MQWFLCGRTAQGPIIVRPRVRHGLRLIFGDARKDDRKRPFSTHNAFPNNIGKKGGGKSWHPGKFGTNHVDPVDQNQDDNRKYEEQDEQDCDEQARQGDNEYEQEEDEGADQDPEAAPDDDD